MNATVEYAKYRVFRPPQKKVPYLDTAQGKQLSRTFYGTEEHFLGTPDTFFSVLWLKIQEKEKNRFCRVFH